MASLTLVTVAKTTAAVDLTALAGQDWACWDGSSASYTPQQRKSGGGSLISGAVFGSGTASLYPSSGRTFSWTNGAPTASGSSSGGDYNSNNSGTGNGMVVTMPADTNVRTARFYGHYYDSDVRITASLSDASVGNQTSDALTGSAFTSEFWYVEVSYAAASAAQTLSLSIQVLTNYSASANCGFQAAVFGMATAGPASIIAAQRRHVVVNDVVVQY